MSNHSFVMPKVERELCTILAAPWQGWSSRRGVLTIAADGRALEIRVDVQDVAPKFECARVTVRSIKPTSLMLPPAPFAAGQNQLSVLLAEEWLEDPELPVAGTLGHAPLAQNAGPIGSAPQRALAICQVTDGLLVQAATGEKIVVRCGWPLYDLDVLREGEEIADFLAERTPAPLSNV